MLAHMTLCLTGLKAPEVNYLNPNFPTGVIKEDVGSSGQALDRGAWKTAPPPPARHFLATTPSLRTFQETLRGHANICTSSKVHRMAKLSPSLSHLLGLLIEVIFHSWKALQIFL